MAAKALSIRAFTLSLNCVSKSRLYREKYAALTSTASVTLPNLIKHIVNLSTARGSASCADSSGPLCAQFIPRNEQTVTVFISKFSGVLRARPRKDLSRAYMGVEGVKYKLRRIDCRVLQQLSSVHEVKRPWTESHWSG